MTPCVPSGIKIRLTKLKTGRSRRYTLCTLPFNKGTKNDPTININAGGTILIIIVFTPFNNFSQYKLCCQNKTYTCNKSISGIKP